MQCISDKLSRPVFGDGGHDEGPHLSIGPGLALQVVVSAVKGESGKYFG